MLFYVTLWLWYGILLSRVYLKIKEQENTDERYRFRDDTGDDRDILWISMFNVYNNNLYIIYGHGFEFAKKRLSNPETISYIEQMIRETINRSFSIKIILESEVKNIELEIKNEKVDKGEEILKSIVKDDILEIRDNEEKQD